MSLHDAVNRSQKAAGGLRLLANATSVLPLVKPLSQLTPASETLQVADLSLKEAAEMLAYTQVNGLPGDSFGGFAASLAEASRKALLPLGAGPEASSAPWG